MPDLTELPRLAVPWAEPEGLTDSIQGVLRGRLRVEITEGRCPPGSRLNSLALARQFGVSQIPVREALRGLEAEGLVTFTHNRGAFVTRLSVGELREAFIIRIALVAAVTREAARRFTAVELDVLGEVVRAGRVALGEPAEFLRRSAEVHSHIHRAARLPRLVQVLDSVSALPAAYQNVLGEFGDLPQLQADHEVLLDACRRHDANSAVQIAEAHESDVRDLLIANFNRLQAD